MKWQLKDVYEWHRCFVWWPMAIDGKAVWLEAIERRATGWHPEVDYFWEYRMPRDDARVTINGARRDE